MKYGRRPPKDAPALRFSEVFKQVPDHPIEVDYLAALIGGWSMLGNDRYGDCVAVTWANDRRLVTATLTGQQEYPMLDQVLEFYKTQNPGFPSEDNGMDIQTALETLHGHGGPDGAKLVAFAKVDHRNEDEVKAAIAIFGGLWTGINVQQAQMDQFYRGKPWDYIPGSPLDGGHSVWTGGYGAGSGTLAGDERFITWAQETSFTDSFWQQNVEEAWVAIWPEHLGSKAFQEGVDLAALATAYTALTGRPFPVVIPTPGPAPTPVPPVVDVDRELAAAQVVWESHVMRLSSPRQYSLELAAAQRAWRKSKGL